MGGSRPFLATLLEQSPGSCHFSNPLGSKFPEHQEKRRSCTTAGGPGRKQTSFSGTRPRRTSRVLTMKRRARQERRPSTRPAKEIERSVRILKKLIPNCSESASVGLDSLFRETTDYILALKIRVEVMQVMVNLLSGSDD